MGDCRDASEMAWQRQRAEKISFAVEAIPRAERLNSINLGLTNMAPLPIISLWQPWASLIFSGAKVHETRSFEPPLKYVGGFIGIHATAKFPPLKIIGEELHELCMNVFGCSYNYTLPQGAILGVARLSGGVPTSKGPASEDDRIAGDWSPGRYAWPLCDVQKFTLPLPAKGKQGWWKFELPLTN